MIDGNKIWEETKALLKASNNQVSYKEIFEPITEIYKVDNNCIFLVVKNKLEMYRLEKYQRETMNKYATKVANQPIEFYFVCKDVIEEEEKKLSSQNKNNNIPNSIKKRNLRSDYTFSNFITGEANREAFTFAVKVAECPSVTINPFYIFGDVGLGKTHLMTAVGHYIYEQNPNTNIVFTTAQQFVEDYFKAKNKNRTSPTLVDEFDNYYRSADVLLVDDIQFLADRQGSQEEFFKLFEYLFENNKQIIITSDRPANELNIMARLKSRFSWGLQTDIRKPNLNLRKAILKSKLKNIVSNPENVPDEVIEYIAENFDENVRELEGAIRRFVTFCISFNFDFTLENAETTLSPIIQKDKVNQNECSQNFIEKVKEVIASYYNINVKELSSVSRKQEFVYARSITVYILKTKYNLTLNKIGAALGGRDHATISHSFDKIAELIKTDQNVKMDVENVTNSLDKLYSNN